MSRIQPRTLRPARLAGLARPWFVWLACTLALGLAAGTAGASPRIVAVGDVHGDLPAFKTVLTQAGLCDATGAWSGGDALLVQLGDLIDRGPSMRGTLDFVMALEQSAAKGGGRVVPLLGNHEVLNVTGDWRYVVPANYAEFADAQSEKRRDDAWRQVQDLARRRAARLGTDAPAFDAAARDAWMQAHPPGYIEHAEAFGPDGVYGRWIRGHAAVLAEDGTAFLHGGIAPGWAATPIPDMNRRVQEDLARFDADRKRFVAEGLILPFASLQDTLDALHEALPFVPEADAERRKVYEAFLDWGAWAINSADGPLWFRGYSQWTDAEGAAEVPRLLAAFHLARIVVGHTPQSGGRIRVRFGGAVFLIDTGMNSAYVPGGRGSALEIAGDTVTAIYSGEPRQVIWPLPAKAAAADAAPAGRSFEGSDGKALPFASDRELLDFLREARVVGVESISEGITHSRKLTLERDGARAHAIFRTVHAEDPLDALGGGRATTVRDFYGFEPAAYRLGLLLGIDYIPPAVLRRLLGEPGSVQIWIEHAITEDKRRKAGTEPPRKLEWQRRLQTRLAWDVLIGNSDRNRGNTLYTPDWRMWLIDHTRTFPPTADLRGAQDIVWCERGFWRNLRAVGDAEIKASVEESLRPAEIAALLGRRRRLVDFLDARIQERGEAAVLFEEAQ